MDKFKMQIDGTIKIHYVGYGDTSMLCGLEWDQDDRYPYCEGERVSSKKATCQQCLNIEKHVKGN